MTPELSERLSQLNELFRAATTLKDDGRKSPEQVDANRQASEKYRQAAVLAHDLLDDPELDADKKAQLEVFTPYYDYEAQRTLVAWHYERHETAEAETCLKKAGVHLEEHICQLEAKLADAEGDLAKHFSDSLAKARFFQQSDELAIGSIKARAAWDRGDFIAALDEYRSLVPKCMALVKHSEELDEPSYYRVSLGNLLGLMANVSGALAKHTAEHHGVPGIIPPDVAFSLVRHTLDSYRAGIAAFEANPEWTQYRDLALLCRQHVEQILKDNRSGWSAMYADLRDDPDLTKIMAGIDPRALKALERGEPVPDDSKAEGERSSDKDTLADRYLTKLKNHPLLAILITIGLVVGALALFTGAVRQLVEFAIWASQIHQAIIPVSLGLAVIVLLVYILGPFKCLESLRPASPMWRYSFLVVPLSLSLLLIRILLIGGSTASTDAIWRRVETPPPSGSFAPPLDLIEDILLGDEYPGGTVVREKVKAWREENDYEPPDVQWVAYQSPEFTPDEAPGKISVASGIRAVVGVCVFSLDGSTWRIRKEPAVDQIGRSVECSFNSQRDGVVRIVVFVFPLTKEAYSIARDDFERFATTAERKGGD